MSLLIFGFFLLETLSQNHNFIYLFIYLFVIIRPQICVNEGFKLQSAQLEIDELGYTSISNDLAGKDWDFYAWNA